MRQTMKMIALILCLVLAVGCLTACGAKHDESLIGKWVTKFPAPVPDVDVNLELDLYMEFNADETAKMYISDEALEQAANEIFDHLYGDLSDKQLQDAFNKLGFSNKEEYMADAVKQLRKNVGEGSTYYWKSDDGEIIMYNTKEDYENDKPAPDGSDKYTVSEDGKTLTIPHPTKGSMVFTKV